MNITRTGKIARPFPAPHAEAVQAELEYLTDQGFAEEVKKAISPENPAWKIRVAGIAAPEC
jgi:hypothetical protein